MAQQPPRDDPREPDPVDPGWVDHILDQLTSRPMPAGPDVEPATAPDAEVVEPAPEPEAPPPVPDDRTAAPAAPPAEGALPAPVPPTPGQLPAPPRAGLLDELLWTDPVPEADTPAPEAQPLFPQPQPAPPPVVEGPAPASSAERPPAPAGVIEPPAPPRIEPPAPPEAPPRSPLPPPIPPPPRRPAPRPGGAPAGGRGDPLLSVAAPTPPPAVERRRRGARTAPDPEAALYDDYEDEAFDEFDEHLEESRSTWRTVAGWVLTVAVAIVLSLLIRSFVAHAFHVESGSMEPALSPGDRILVNKLSDNPSRGDLVVFARPDGDLVKRVIALEGETVIFDEGLVRIGDKWLNEPYLSAGTGTYARAAIPNCDPTEGFEEQTTCTVPEGHVFVLGDNRDVSFDSRNFGPIAREDLIGAAAFQFWPLGDLRGL